MASNRYSSTQQLEMRQPLYDLPEVANLRDRPGFEKAVDQLLATQYDEENWEVAKEIYDQRRALAGTGLASIIAKDLVELMGLTEADLVTETPVEVEEVTDPKNEPSVDPMDAPAPSELIDEDKTDPKLTHPAHMVRKLKDLEVRLDDVLEKMSSEQQSKHKPVVKEITKMLRLAALASTRDDEVENLIRQMNVLMELLEGELNEQKPVEATATTGPTLEPAPTRTEAPSEPPKPLLDEEWPHQLDDEDEPATVDTPPPALIRDEGPHGTIKAGLDAFSPPVPEPDFGEDEHKDPGKAPEPEPVLDQPKAVDAPAREPSELEMLNNEYMTILVRMSVSEMTGTDTEAAIFAREYARAVRSEGSSTVSSVKQALNQFKKKLEAVKACEPIRERITTELTTRFKELMDKVDTTKPVHTELVAQIEHELNAAKECMDPGELSNIESSIWGHLQLLNTLTTPKPSEPAVEEPMTDEQTKRLEAVKQSFAWLQANFREPTEDIESAAKLVADYLGRVGTEPIDEIERRLRYYQTLVESEVRRRAMQIKDRFNALVAQHNRTSGRNGQLAEVVISNLREQFQTIESNDNLQRAVTALNAIPENLKKLQEYIEAQQAEVPPPPPHKQPTAPNSGRWRGWGGWALRRLAAGTAIALVILFLSWIAGRMSSDGPERPPPIASVPAPVIPRSTPQTNTDCDGRSQGCSWVDASTGFRFGALASNGRYDDVAPTEATSCFFTAGGHAVQIEPCRLQISSAANPVRGCPHGSSCLTWDVGRVATAIPFDCGANALLGRNRPAGCPNVAVR